MGVNTLTFNAARPLQVISLGAGVQSSTMLLMALRGEITPLPDHAIFADTGDEPRTGGPFAADPEKRALHGLGVYGWLNFLKAETARLAPSVQIHVVDRGRLSTRTLQLRISGKTGRIYQKSLVPFFVKKPDGGYGLLTRRCTEDHKIVPIVRKLRELARLRRGEQRVMVEQWIGISCDEVLRMKGSRHRWIRHRWPLVDIGMNREDCLRWMATHGYPQPPRSACVQCPFHDNREWLRLKTEQPEDFQAAVEYERQYQKVATQDSYIEGVPFLHRSCVPLDQIDFDALVASVQESPNQEFTNDCTGVCGN